MAPIYDEFTAANDYEVWLGEVLLPELSKHGLLCGRVLDVGCGTGRAFGPLWCRGWDYWGCDVSAEILRLARLKPLAHGPQRLPARHQFQADARQLPDLPEPFDLIIALNDVVNYLTEDGDLELAFEGMKRNLAPHGLVCLDANTLGYFESSFTPKRDENHVELGNSPVRERGWEWTGLTADPQPGGIFEAELTGEGIEAPSIHRERHWSPDQVEGAMSASGLSCLAALGQREDEGGIHLDTQLDEQRHYKVIYIGGHRE